MAMRGFGDKTPIEQSLSYAPLPLETLKRLGRSYSLLNNKRILPISESELRYMDKSCSFDEESCLDEY